VGLQECYKSVSTDDGERHRGLREDERARIHLSVTDIIAVTFSYDVVGRCQEC
jgi:hypothetical protein